MGFELLIHGVDYTDEFDKDSLTIRESLLSRGSSMSVDVVHKIGAGVDRPLGGQQIIFKRDGQIEFAGRIANVLETQPGGPLDLRYKLNCIDYTNDLDSHLIIRDYPAQDAADIVRSMIGDVGLGFVTAGVVAGAVDVGGVEADYDRPSDLISRIAESIEHQWYVDYERNVHFYYITAEPAPVAVIDMDSDLDTYYDLEREEMWDQVKNRIWLKGAKTQSTHQDNITFTADGDQKFIPLNYEPWDTETLELTVGGVPYNVLLDTVEGQAGDGQGEANTGYLCVDNWGVRFPENHVPPAETPITVDYKYANELVLMVEDTDSIEQMAAREHIEGAPSDGVHELKYQIPALRVASEQTVWEYGQLLLARYAQIVWAYRFGSERQGWRAGQTVRVVSTRRDIDHQLYVTSVQKTIRTSVNEALLEYQVEALTTPFPG